MNDYKILVVDDELDMRTFITTLLETNGYKPVAATDGKEGLELARKVKPDLIILDITMPVMTGIEMLEKLKAERDLKDIPVIMLTAGRESRMVSKNHRRSIQLNRQKNLFSFIKRKDRHFIFKNSTNRRISVLKKP